MVQISMRVAIPDRSMGSGLTGIGDAEGSSGKNGQKYAL
jgi:hypothetical protein